MLYSEFKKKPYPLYSIIFLNIMMCFFGFSVSFTRTDTEWARITLCVLWCLMLFASSLNQGHLYMNICTRMFDICNAIVLLVVYTILYWYTMEWWHVASGILSIITFTVIHLFFIDTCTLTQYVNVINIWHLWVMLQIFLIPYTIPEGKLIG